MNRKENIISIAKDSFNFTIDAKPPSPLFLMRYVEWLTPYYSFLYLVSREFKPKVTVEIGTSWGFGATHLALGNPEGRVYTIEINQEFSDIFKSSAYYQEINNVEIIQDNSSNAVHRFENDSIDLLFIDGNHAYEVAKEDYDNYFPKVKEGGIILIDDIDFTDGMRRFWEEIKEDKFDVNYIRPIYTIRPGQGVGFGVVLK
jgi:predicted O-methyltransferase YrrM